MLLGATEIQRAIEKYKELLGAESILKATGLRTRRSTEIHAHRSVEFMVTTVRISRHQRFETILKTILERFLSSLGRVLNWVTTGG